MDVIFNFCITTDNNYIFFRSFAGQYNDNPKYISIKLHEMDKNLIIIWDISKKSREKNLPNYIIPVKHNSLKYMYFKNKSCVVIDNGAGDHLVIKKRKIVLHKLLKNRRQLNLSTWHGTPLKKIGVDIETDKIDANGFFSTSDIILAGSNYVKDIFECCFLRKIPVWLSGTPRNDLFFDLNAEKKETLKKKLDLPTDKKIILYAPTYREDIYFSGVMQMKSIDFNLLLSVLEDIFGGEWVFVFRIHQMVLLEINTKFIVSKYLGKVIDGNQHDDMAEYLAVTDVLITDYSGSMFDFALTGKPCFLLTPDKEKYKNERGLYMYMNELPFSFANDFDELITNIKNFDYVNYQQQVDNFLEKLGNKEDGKASDRVAQLVLEYIKTNKVEIPKHPSDHKK